MLTEALEAFQKALEVRTFDALPPQWAQTHNNLAKTFMALGEWAEAAQSYRNVLRVYADYAEAYSTLGSLYHERLFNFDDAFALRQAWLESHPDDVSAQSNFAENHFTTGRFAAAEKRLAVLLADPDLEPALQITLRALEIAALSAQQKTEPIPDQLGALMEVISAQPEGFKLEWSWDGTKHFIRTDTQLAAGRDWLLSMFAALEGEDRAAILTALQASEASLVAALKP